MVKTIRIDELREAIESEVLTWDNETLINFAIDEICERVKRDKENGLPAQIMFDDADGSKHYRGGLTLTEAQKEVESMGADAFYVVELIE